MNTLIFKTSERSPDFPCYLWHATEKTWIFATDASCFVDGWQQTYTHWHVNQVEWPATTPNGDTLKSVFDKLKKDFENVRPRPGTPSRADRRYVYSAGCTFHGPISQIGVKKPRDGSNFSLPCCPSCGSMLFEMETQERWDRQIQEFAKKKGDTAYPAFMAWFGALRPCRPVRNQADFDARRAEFDALPKT